MGLFEQLSGLLGGPQQAHQQAQRFANGQVNLQDPTSPDAQQLNQMVGVAPPQYVQQSVAQAAQQVDPQEYAAHITPGVGGTNPLGGLERGALGMVAGSLLGSLTGGGGGGGAIGSNPSRLLQLVPGLQTTNPQQMGPQEVAALASYMQQNHPQAFGQAAAQVAQQQPDLLHSLLGNKAVMLAAAGIGAKFLEERTQRR